jgi:hypothetical protein
MAKKTKKKPTLNRHIVMTLVGIVLVVALLAIFAIFYALPTVYNQQRLERINAIYKSLGLSSDYVVQSQNVFGDKRVYSWDKSRTFSSSETFVRSANVDTTVAELKKDIAKTDFTFYQEPYPGSADWQYIYKSPKNEYLRVTVSSKLRDDAFFNDYHMNGKFSDATFAISPNAGPSNVTIKVNLDDNNE